MNKLIITNGDAAVAFLRTAGFQADILPWRDVLHDGPVPQTSENHTLDLESLSAMRAAFLSDVFGQPNDDVCQSFVERDRTLRGHDTYDEVTLWFEHDLYDQLQLLQILSFFHREKRKGSLQLVQADDYLTHQNQQVITRFNAQKTLISVEQLRLADDLFQAFREPTPKRLVAFLKRDLAALPFMKSALNRLFEELPHVASGLSRTQLQTLRTIQRRELSARRLFAEVQTCEEAVFMGDWSFWRCLEELVFNRSPLLQGLPFRIIESADNDQQQRYLDAELSLTEIGKSVLAGEIDHAELNVVDRWLGGTHLAGKNLWRWDHNAEELVPPS